MAGNAANLPNPPNYDELVELQAGCCSHDYQNCASWCKPELGSDKCAHCHEDGTMVWLPEGEDMDSNSTCLSRYDGQFRCSKNEDCCGTLVCDGVATNHKWTTCKQPETLCATYLDEDTCEAGRLSYAVEPPSILTQNCAWDGSTCVPSFDWKEDRGQTADLPPPADLEDLEAFLAGCCSSDHETCVSWCNPDPKDRGDCSACGDGLLVWLPQKGASEANAECLSRLEGSIQCSSNSDCCGSLVCDASESNPNWVMCHDPTTVCGTYTSEDGCVGGRLSFLTDPPTALAQNCAWENNKCVPSFDWTVVGSSNSLPLSQDEGLTELLNGCCSNDQKNCATWCVPQKGDDKCGACGKGDLVFLPDKNSEKDSSCLSRWQGNIQCHTNDECCGSLVCDATSQNPGWVTCKHPVDVCSSFQNENACIFGRLSRAAWSNEPPEVLSQNCAWENDACVPIFDWTVQGRGRPTEPSTQPIPADLIGPGLVDEDNPDYLGLCKGYVGSIWGDPHAVTFDRKEFDCQAHGEFVLVDSPGKINIQSRFTVKDNPNVSVLTGVAVATPSTPTIQIGYAEYDSGEDSSFYFWGDCAVHFYIGGELQDVADGDILSGPGYTISAFKSAVEIQFFDDEQPTSSLKIKGSGSKFNDLGCLMATFVCLTDSDPELLEGTVGLLGTPNSDPNDEWKIRGVEEVDRVVKWGDVPYQHCTTHYCVSSESQSLFVHEDEFGGQTFDELSNCNAPYPGDIDLTSVDPKVVEICGEDRDCLMEGATGGEGNAINGRSISTSVKEIQATPDLVDLSVVLVDTTPLVPLQNEICPEDVELVDTFGVTALPARPLRIISRDAEGFTLQVKSAAFENMERVYIEYEGQDRRKYCAKSSADNFFSEPLHIFCPPHIHTTLIHVTGSDSLLMNGDAATVSDCCEAQTDTNPKVKYTFIIPCVSLCPDQDAQQVRRLRARD